MYQEIKDRTSPQATGLCGRLTVYVIQKSTIVLARPSVFPGFSSTLKTRPYFECKHYLVSAAGRAAFYGRAGGLEPETLLCHGQAGRLGLAGGGGR